MENIKDGLGRTEKEYAFLLKIKAQWEEILRKTVVVKAEIEELKKIMTDDVPENCEGMLGYETSPVGDGVWGSYFDNEDFNGNGVKEPDFNIQFEWNGGRPLNGINHENFGVRWEAWLKAPASGEYSFTSITDDGA